MNYHQKRAAFPVFDQSPPIQSRAASAIASNAATFRSSRVFSSASPRGARAGAGAALQARSCCAARCAAERQASPGSSFISSICRF
ncbi:Uncharacterized protein HZ326_31867, partial [Fusarium oxysporum f. sp. albedinis]